MSRFLTLGSYFAIQDFLSGWFHGTPFDQIHRGNCVAFVAYAFYNRDYDDLPPRVGFATVLLASTSCILSLFCWLARFLTHTLTHSLARSLTRSLTHSLTHLLAHSLTRSLTRLLLFSQRPLQNFTWSSAVLCCSVTALHSCFLFCEESHHLHSGSDHCIFKTQGTKSKATSKTKPCCSRSGWSISIMLCVAVMLAV